MTTAAANYTDARQRREREVKAIEAETLTISLPGGAARVSPESYEWVDADCPGRSSDSTAEPRQPVDDTMVVRFLKATADGKKFSKMVGVAIGVPVALGAIVLVTLGIAIFGA